MPIKRLEGFYSYLTLIILALILLISNSCGNENKPHPNFGGVVSAATLEAAGGGVEILEAGGNAIDAAVGVSFASAVTEPAMSGLGGGTQIIMHAPGQEPLVINGTSLAPKATPVNARKDDIKGHRATTIPSTVRTLHLRMEEIRQRQNILAKNVRAGYSVCPRWFQNRTVSA